jgi:hypothetical protein
LASEFIVADRFPKFTGKKCCLFLGFEYYYGYPSVRHFFEKSFFHCLESIFEREPLVAIAKNFAGNNATGVVSSAVDILIFAWLCCLKKFEPPPSAAREHYRRCISQITD